MSSFKVLVAWWQKFFLSHPAWPGVSGTFLQVELRCLLFQDLVKLKSNCTFSSRMLGREALCVWDHSTSQLPRHFLQCWDGHKDVLTFLCGQDGSWCLFFFKISIFFTMPTAMFTFENLALSEPTGGEFAKLWGSHSHHHCPTWFPKSTSNTAQR